jgi:dephospho-CoA kinase
MKIIGLTGLLGSGKTTVAAIFAEYGVTTINTDSIVHTILADKNCMSFRAILEIFGNSILHDTGVIDRNKLRTIVFANPAQKYQLEQIIHPAVYSNVIKQLDSLVHQRLDYIIIEVPLLLKTNTFLPIVNRSLLIDCDESIIKKHLEVSRPLLTQNMIATILSQQLPRALQLSLASDVIINNQDISNLKQQVHAIHGIYQQKL